MRRRLVLAFFAGGLLAACNGARASRDAAGAAAEDRPGGEILYAARAGGHLERRVVKPGGGAPRRLAREDGVELYPAPGAPGLLVAVAARGHDEAHVEQLRVGPTLAAAGPTAMRVRNPAATRDGKAVFFEADHESFRSLYRLDVAGGQVTRLTFDDAGSFEPSPSPDGRRLVFASSREGQPDLFIMNADGSGADFFAAGPGEQVAPIWSPDGQRIAFVSNQAGTDRLYVRRHDVREPPRRVTDEPADGPVTEADAVWSPDGTRLAYTRVDGPRAAVYVVEVPAAPDAPAATPRRLSTAGARAESPTWSPDGRHLAFVEGEGDARRLVTARADGSGTPKALTPPGDLLLPRWR